jgi:hypothetical protein
MCNHQRVTIGKQLQLMFIRIEVILTFEGIYRLKMLIHHLESPDILIDPSAILSSRLNFEVERMI